MFVNKKVKAKKDDKAEYLQNLHQKFDFVADKKWRSVMRCGITYNKKNLLFITISPPKNPDYQSIVQLAYDIGQAMDRFYIRMTWVTEFDDRRIHFHGLMDIHGRRDQIDFYTTSLKDLLFERAFVDIKPVTYLTGIISYMTKDVYLNRIDGFEPIGLDIQVPGLKWRPNHWIRTGYNILVDPEFPTHSTPPHASPTGDGRGLPEEGGTTHPCGMESDDAEDNKNDQF